MRKAGPALALFALLAAATTAATPPIQPEAILGHIRFLSSDELGGRGNGSEGLVRAGEYVAQQFEMAGLQPAGTNGEWFQSFELIAGLGVGEGNSLVVRSDSRSVSFELGSSYYPLAATPNDDSSAVSNDFDGLPLVFAGYGIAAAALGYDDYANIDVDGKAVLIFSHEPQENQRNSRLNGRRPLREATLNGKAVAARSRGARVLLVISDPSHRRDQANYGLFAIDADAVDLGIPVLRVRRDEMRPLIQAWGLDRLAAEIDDDLEPRSRVLTGLTVEYTELLSRNRRTVRNVVGILAGSDSAVSGEAIVIGAHYDHVGVGGRFSMTPDRTGEIHNGADDNASGTASIIEIARAASADVSRFPRSLVFVAFAGEERGLLGSAYYANNPAVPLDRTVAMLNLDMVGRSNGRVDVSGLEKAPQLESLLMAASQPVGIQIRREGPGAGRSDDSNFLARRIPAINFFTGFHDDYHRPTDDWNKIDAPGTARVATLALEFAARIARQRERLVFAD